MSKPLLVVLTGAGISAESGIATFRDSDGLWEGHAIEDVATPDGWRRNPALVLDFYNQRRRSVVNAQPNRGHKVLAELEKQFEVVIVTQNVDDLHERAGSTNVIHLHGSLLESRSTKDALLIYPINGWELNPGDLCELGSQLRPNIVWFGEEVPLMEVAMEAAAKASFFLVVGTSLVVYPAAGLIAYVPRATPKFILDPKVPELAAVPNLMMIAEKASTGMEKVQTQLLSLLDGSPKSE